VNLQFQAETPLSTTLTFAVRYGSSADSLRHSTWQPIDGEGRAFNLAAPGDARFMQYRARLISPNGGPTPYLKSVTVTFQE
jgi:hypothetical protein